MIEPPRKPEIDVLDMRYFWYVGRYLVWVGVRFPWVHIKRSKAR